MSKTELVNEIAAARGRLPTLTVIPFTSGLIIFIYAWFWPEGYGRWLGTIVHGFRSAAGL